MQRYFAKNEKLELQDTDIHHIKNVMRMSINDKIEVIYNKKNVVSFDFQRIIRIFASL